VRQYAYHAIFELSETGNGGGPSHLSCQNKLLK
jgi:hypothetical protein